MGGTQSNVQANNLIVLLHMDDNKKTIQFLEQQMNDQSQQFYLNKPINKMGDTILHYAAYKKNKDLIQYLLKHGASVSIKNNRDLMPKEVVSSQDQDIIQLLETGQKH